MKDTEIRIECLKLTYAHGREAAEAVERAKELETYVVGKRKPGRPKKSGK